MVAIFPFLGRSGLKVSYLVISIRGRGITRLLNLTARKGINFWDLNYSGNSINVKMSPRDFKKLRPLLHRTGCTAEIVHKKGPLFVILKGKRRKGLTAGLVLFCLIIFFLSLFIWNINIEGNEDIPSEKILSVLKNHGVEKGVLKSKLDIDTLEDRIILDIPELSWVNISIRGVHFNLEVVERDKEPPPEEEAHLIAAKDGLVKEVLVLAGRAVVEPGDTVREGDLLISKKIMPEAYMFEEENMVEYNEEDTARARGIVKARVWYEGSAQVPLMLIQKQKTNQSEHGVFMRVGDSNYHLWGARISPYDNYIKEETKWSPAWRNHYLPVELVRNNFKELKIETIELSKNEALHEATRKAMEEVHEKSPEGVTINMRYVEEYFFEEFERVGCRVVVETEEDIAVPGYGDKLE